jgi:D-alanyl-D-alanine carboxypeptidase/D-alanyl-D-alanine-endopeptidase (penicillin-binding protein 4)
LVVIAGLAAIPAILLTGVWQYADAQVPAPTTTTTTTVAPPPAPALDTSLLSYRRHPEPLAEQAAADETARIQAASSQALLDLVPDGSCVRLVAGDTVVAEEGTGTPVIPASNQKLLVAAVALDVLGPDYRFRTELHSLAPVAGVVPGNLYLVGGGDPVLRTAGVPDPQTHPAFNTTALESLADQVVAMGITTIEGDVVGDGSRYDDEFRVPTWGEGITSAEAGPYDALLVNDGLISEGNYGLDPSRSAARIFYDLLAARGVVIGGSAANSARPADAGLAPLASIESLPLTEVLVELLHTSDDNTAEMLVKEIGFTAAGQGTRQAGLDTIRSTLAGWAVPAAGLELYDGSGLDRGNRVTCETLLALLTATPVSAELVALLPVAGRDGTLAEQLLGTPAEGEMRAKTGTLTDVKALSGSLPDAHRRPVEFSLVLNAPDADEPSVYGPVWESLVELIDEYPVVVEPDTARFGPR